MTTASWPELVRGRASELLLDLVYVFVLTRFSVRLIEDFTTDRRIVITEAGQTAILLLAVWLIWVQAAWVTSRFDPQDPVIQLVITWIMFGSMIIAVTLPHAFGKRAVTFAVAYVAIQIGRPLLLLLVRRDGTRHDPVRTVCWGLASAVPWIAGAVLVPQSPARGALWTLAVALDYAGFRLGWPVPGLGRTRIADWRISGQRLAERYQQFIVIGLGETILLTGLTFATDFRPEEVAPTVVSFATTMLFWQLYFHRAGSLLPAAIEAAPRPARLGRSGIYTHLAMLTGILAAGVGQALVIKHPFDDLDPAWLAVILGGPVLFLAGRTWLEYEVFTRVSASRLIALLALGALAPATMFLPPLVATTAAAGVLAGLVVRDAIREWKQPPQAPAPRP
jgi:low temperature requirement protein LtrA